MADEALPAIGEPEERLKVAGVWGCAAGAGVAEPAEPLPVELPPDDEFPPDGLDPVEVVSVEGMFMVVVVVPVAETV
ncbi:MAG TPA: hypothetical protein VK252_04070, partial [Solirubrobacteraceae bacterium]|nr:hypothetical protein [Solirubrobacteraceae bacterium]